MRILLLSLILVPVLAPIPSASAVIGTAATGEGTVTSRRIADSAATTLPNGQYNVGTLLSQLPKRGQSHGVIDFGSLATGADDTARLQAAITASAGKTLWLSDGVYKISPNASRTLFLSIPAKTKIIGSPGAVLQVAASAGYYDSILTIADGTGVVLKGFTIDSNIANNPIADSTEISSHARIEVKVLKGTSTVIEGITFKNSSSENTIFANFSSGVIRNNIVLANGTDPHLISHDNSVIYTGFSTGNVVAGNILTASAIAAPAATTAIEIHGSNHIVTGNMISDFANCIILAGVDLQDSVGNILKSNTCTGALTGIQMASLQYSTHTSGYGINGLVVARNYIRINQSSYTGRTAGSNIFADPTITFGIAFNTANSLPVRNVIVSHNTLIWDQEGDVARSPTSVGAGVYANANQYTKIEFGGNTLENAPLTGIRFEAACDACKFHDNTIRDAASTGAGVAAAAADRTALFFYGLKTFNGLEVYNNTVIDDFNTTRLHNHIFAGAGSLCSDVMFVNNSLITADSTHSNLLGYMTLVDSRVRPYLVAVMPSGYFAGLAQAVKSGSTYVDLGTKQIWTSQSGRTWLISNRTKHIGR